jgi:hypothetical protein
MSLYLKILQFIHLILFRRKLFSKVYFYRWLFATRLVKWLHQSCSVSKLLVKNFLLAL